ncbi:hypothetical protein SJ05684_c21560 [Sinorhizobium sojae CCBAU 05684]|uniref:Uncharacterized protein n=2 Tax=Sinorhizobium sojae TaxID=716925 RepID=A0A249PD07_9HYPH|nr:hypothetical protein SJ05684_c21560 [Sinorhizobium sojae CCBAU 05684]
MASGLELLNLYNEPPKNTAVESFIADATKVKTAIRDGKVSGKGRSPVKLVGDTYEVKLLGQMLYVPKVKVNGLLDDLIKAAKDEDDKKFRAKIEEHYKPDGVPSPEGQAAS